jgi:UDP-3-O-[3-hydroxymyristoyl] glucosamine N-acyltransferase
MAPEAATAGDSRFFRRTGPHALSLIASVADAVLPAEAPGERLFRGVAPLQAAGPEEIAFLENRRYTDLLGSTSAGAVIVQPALAPRLRAGAIALCTAEPRVGWARVAALFFPDPAPVAGRHATAVVDPTADVDPSAELGPLCVIGAGAVIGPRCRIGPAAVIGAGVVLGADCRIGAHASLSHALVGARVNILPGARIGQEGFGFEPTPAGFLTVPQLGRVILEDDVEVGANTTIDRGAGPDTVIGAGSRLDNLVQIGHNVRLGRACVIAGQAGISGSTVLEDFVQMGGQAGLTGHLHIGRGARLGAQAGILTDVAAGADVVGSPAQPVREFFRHVAFLRRLVRQGLAGTTPTEAGAPTAARSGARAPAPVGAPPDGTGADKSGADRSGADRSGGERSGAERSGAQWSGADRPADAPVAGKSAVDTSSAETSAGDRPADGESAPRRSGADAAMSAGSPKPGPASDRTAEREAD